MSRNILVVDDDAAVISLVRQRLQRAGYSIFTAYNGKEGLKTCERYNIDVIITDVVMPEMDGVDFYRELKRREKTEKIPIVIMTDRQVFKDSFRKLGVEGFISKPLDLDKVIDQIRKVFSLIEEGGRGKVLVVGNDQDTSDEMCFLLKKQGYFVNKARDSKDFMGYVLTMVPDFVFIDVLLKDVSACEIIKAMKCFISLKDTKIFTYTIFSTEELNDVEAIEQLRESKDNCISAGSTKYIGRFTRPTFIQCMYEYW